MNRIAVAGFAWLLVVSAGARATAPQDAAPVTQASTQTLSLEQIMSDPDWIGPPVEEPY